MTSSARLAAQVSFLCRLILDIRLFVLFLTIIWIGPSAAARPAVPVAIVLTALASFMPMWYWDRLAPSMLRSPTFIVTDVIVAVGLLTLTGAQGPALHFALTTAALGGLLRGRRGAALVALALIGGYELVLFAHDALRSASFQELVGAPALFPMAASAGAAVRHLLDRQARMESALGQAVQAAAAADERARLAREMHDSLAKTLQGIALSAAALESWAGRDPGRAKALADGVARAAQTAAQEARELISDLRHDRLDAPLDEAVRSLVTAWSKHSDLPAFVDLAIGGASVSPGTRYEVLCILKEALRNVERHARASATWVALRADGGVLSLVVSDDGVGFGAAAPSLAALADDGHYGVVGMAERAQRVGGTLTVGAAATGGARVELRVPLSPVEPRLPSQPAAPLPRGVPV
jgi:signal transduction histidine kinase